jgi:hypothetical protein
MCTTSPCTHDTFPLENMISSSSAHMHILNIDRVLMLIKQYLFLIDELFHLYSNVI